MKKTYIQPNIEVVALNNKAALLSNSPGYGGNTTETSGNLSRRGGFFEDEEEDW